METTTKLRALIAGIAVCMIVPLGAHHSWTVEYDGGKPISVKGVVSKVEWTNPHTHFYVDVRSDDGSMKTWNFEMASTLALERAGWSRKTLPIGVEVSVKGFAGRAVSERAIANSITAADGKLLFDGNVNQ